MLGNGSYRERGSCHSGLPSQASTVTHTAAFGLMYYNARWYAPQLGRFVQADTLVPEPGSPLAWDRYAYVNDNPVKYSDPSGHCWGAFGWVRGLPGYGTTCDNLEMVWTIVTSPDTSTRQKAVAGAYIFGEDAAHAALVVGVAGLACSAVSPCAQVAEAALGVSSTACADGDCTNEVAAAANAVDHVVNAACADGDRANEINTGTNVVYQYVENGVTRYVGITKDFPRWFGEHLRTKGWNRADLWGGASQQV